MGVDWGLKPFQQIRSTAFFIAAREKFYPALGGHPLFTLISTYDILRIGKDGNGVSSNSQVLSSRSSYYSHVCHGNCEWKQGPTGERTDEPGSLNGGAVCCGKFTVFMFFVIARSIHVILWRRCSAGSLAWKKANQRIPSISTQLSLALAVESNRLNQTTEASAPKLIHEFICLDQFC